MPRSYSCEFSQSRLDGHISPVENSQLPNLLSYQRFLRLSIAIGHHALGLFTRDY
jgi:hypothetical protein